MTEIVKGVEDDLTDGVEDDLTVLTEETCCADETSDHAHVPDALKESLIKRMNRIEGQARGIKGMIERNVYCDDILNQMSAVQSALNAVSRLLLESHMKTCVIEKLKTDDSYVVEEFLKTVSKLMK